jgi:hypothetical protein
MRKLSDRFMAELHSGFLSALTNQIVADKDLDLQIRDNYLNVYYKGNSLLKLTEVAGHYKVDIHNKFRDDLNLPTILDSQTTPQFMSLIPQLKDNIVRYGKSSLEVEYEQLIIRANNLEPRNNSEYFVVDRQYAIGQDRFDLIGVFWNRHGRKHSQELPLCFMEVKFALNSDIKAIQDQVQRYYLSVQGHAMALAEEVASMFRQKLELGLYNQSPERIAAMKTLRVSSDISLCQFIIVLVDYNPYSTHLDLGRLKALPFANQIRIFRSGFAMWHEQLSTLNL